MFFSNAILLLFAILRKDTKPGLFDGGLEPGGAAVEGYNVVDLRTQQVSF